MEIILHTLIVLELSLIANSFNVYEPARVPGWNYFGYSWMDQKPSYVFRKPMAAMVDLTNDLGVAILQDYSYSRSNFAFSPYGVASVLVVLYEGARGESARQIHRAIRFPWDKDITRIGFRDIHRHLRSYFSHEGYLSGITLNKDGSTLKQEYKRILRFYGYDVDVDSPGRTSHAPPTTTVPSSSIPPTNSTTSGNDNVTTEGYDVTGKEPETIITGTIKPEDITSSSSDESMTTLTTTEGRESPLMTTITVANSLATEGPTIEVTEVSAVTTIKEQLEGNTGVSAQQNTHNTEKTNQEDTEQNTEHSTPAGNKQDAGQNSQENPVQSSEGSNAEDSEHDGQGDNEQNMEQDDDTQDTTEQDTPGNNLQDAEQDNSTDTAVNTEQTDQENTQVDAEQSTHPSTPASNEPNVELHNTANTEQDIELGTHQNTEQSTQELGQGNPAGIEQNIEGDTEQDHQKTTEDSKPESTGLDAQPGIMTEVTPLITTAEGDSSSITNPVTEVDEATNSGPTTRIIETTTLTDDVEEVTVTTPINIEEELAALQDAEVVGNLTTEEGDRSSRSDALDNGMLVPQLTNGRYTYFDDNSGLAYSNPDKRNLIDYTTRIESTSEYWKEVGVALIAEGDEVKWEPKTLDEFFENLMRESASGANRERRLASGDGGGWRWHEWDSRSVSSGEKLLLRDVKISNGNATGRRSPIDVETSAKLKRRHSTKKKRNISEFLKIPPVTDLSLQLQNGMFDSHVSKDTDLYRVLPKFLFLVDGAIDTPVSMMTYTNIFPFAYIPRLHCKALEFPLDDERYKLLILLPVERRGLRQLIYDLSSYPLREVMNVLRPTRVKAMVPTFMVEGFVILTSTLQKMGIWDVFDPRRADLSGMTSDPDLYVRNIEQSVTVVIRNYVEILDIQTRTMAARHIDEDFTASHPFLYFVMDTATNVALMAGQMLDPLNSRIY